MYIVNEISKHPQELQTLMLDYRVHGTAEKALYNSKQYKQRPVNESSNCRSAHLPQQMPTQNAHRRNTIMQAL